MTRNRQEPGRAGKPPLTPADVNGGVMMPPPGLQTAVSAREEAARRQREFDTAVNALGDDQAEPGALGWEPVGDRVAVRRHEVTRTESGLELAGGGADSIRTPTGTVLAVGPDCKQVRPGDTVSCDPTVPCFPMMWRHGKFFVFLEKQIVGIERHRPGAPDRTPVTPVSDDDLPPNSE